MLHYWIEIRSLTWPSKNIPLVWNQRILSCFSSAFKVIIYLWYAALSFDFRNKKCIKAENLHLSHILIISFQIMSLCVQIIMDVGINQHLYNILTLQVTEVKSCGQSTPWELAHTQLHWPASWPTSIPTPTFYAVLVRVISVVTDARSALIFAPSLS